MSLLPSSISTSYDTTPEPNEDPSIHVVQTPVSYTDLSTEPTLPTCPHNPHPCSGSIRLVSPPTDEEPPDSDDCQSMCRLVSVSSLSRLDPKVGSKNDRHTRVRLVTWRTSGSTTTNTLSPPLLHEVPNNSSKSFLLTCR